MAPEIKNRRAFFDYEIITKYVAGVVLTGDEVKAIRQGKVAISDAYGFVRNEEVFIINMHITPYSSRAIIDKTNPIRMRKLLLKKSEIKKIMGSVSRKGLTLIPLNGFFGSRGFFKIVLALAKHKKTFDKKESIKQKDLDRELRRQLKDGTK